MSLIPKSVVGKIEFCENHVSPWTTNAVAIGTTSAAVTDWSTKTTAARAAYQAQQAAQSAARDATNDLNTALDALMIATSSIIKQVRAKADMSGNGIYSLASLPVPPTPSPMPPPGTPYKFAVEIMPSGALELKWKCDNPAGSQGTLYQIGRKVDDATTFEYLGGAGTKSFTDTTLPAGASTITYRIQAVRSTAVGVEGVLVVNIGTGSGGGMTVSVVEPQGAPKIAA